MKLSEVFNQLAHGELTQLALVDDTTGTIKTSKYPVIVSNVNLAMAALHKRFNMKEGRLSFYLETGRLTYPLSTAEDVNFFEGNGDEEFTDNILKIERVYTDTGYELGLNDESDSYSCSTPTATTLRLSPLLAAQSTDLPSQLLTKSLTVVYRANPTPIKYTDSFNPARVDIELPYSHLEPLLFFVASRIHNPIGMTNEFHAGNNYAAKYEKACLQLEESNIQTDQGSQSTKLIRNGWV